MILYSPMGMQGALRMCAWVCGGSKEGGKEEAVIRGPAKPIAGARGVWVGLQVLENWMRYLCTACTWTSRCRGRYAVRQSLGRIIEL